MTDDVGEHLQHSALRTDLSFAEVTARFWDEVRPLRPVSEVHVVDPYLLSAGNRDPEVHAGNVAGLLKPLLRNISSMTLVYRHERAGVREAVLRSLRSMLPSSTEIRFVRPDKFHHRWVVADRSRLVRMDLSFNQIGQALGGVDLVTAERDCVEYCDVLNHQDPLPA